MWRVPRGWSASMAWPWKRWPGWMPGALRDRWFPSKPHEADSSYAQPDMDSYDPETTPVRVDVRDLQRRVGSSLAAKKADAVVRISFALRNSAFSARRRFNSAAVSSAPRAASAPAVRSALFLHLRNVSDEMPRPCATEAKALVSDE